jgi:hypothetical protein
LSPLCKARPGSKPAALSVPSEKLNLAAQYPDTVSALQQRANSLAAEAAKPMLLELGFQEILHQFHLPPAFPGEEFELKEER